MFRYCIIVALSICFVPRLVLAYDATLAHPLLAEQGYRHWRQLGPWAEVDQARTLLQQGASDEDRPVCRVLNHFYNPLTNQGLSLWGRQIGVSAITWLHLDDYQSSAWNSCSGRGGDFGWTASLNQVQNNSLNEAWLGLGHNLHLLTDMASPAHVHNDQHLEGDNYETWVRADLTADSDLSWAVNLDMSVPCDSATTCLQRLAQFTAKRALSRDWSALENLPADAELDAGGKVWTDQGLIAKYDELTDSLILDTEVHGAYWRDLAPRIVAYESKLIEVFWREADVNWVKQEVQVPVAPEQVKVRALPETTPPKLKLITQPVTAVAPLIKYAPPVNLPAPSLTPSPVLVEPVTTPWSEIINDSNLWFWPIIDESANIPSQYLRVELPVLPVGSNAKQSLDIPDDPPDETPDETPDDVPDETPDETPDDVPDDPGDDSGDSDDSGGSGGGGISDDNPVPVTPSLSFTNLNSTYQNNLNLNWEIQPAGTWLFDLSYQLDDGSVQSALNDVSDQNWIYQAESYHKKITVHLSATSSAGLSTSTEALINFEPQWSANLLAYWPMDDCGGGVISEVVAGNHLTQNALWTTGRIACAIKQDGLDSQSMGRWLLTPMTASSLTISFFWRNEAGQEAGLNANGLVLADSNQYWLAGIRPGVYNSTYWTHDEEKILDYQMPSDHQWHHVAVTFDGSGMKFYLDGTVAIERAGDASLNTDIAKFYLRGNASLAEFDELSWWRGVLSESQISDLARGGRLWE